MNLFKKIDLDKVLTDFTKVLQQTEGVLTEDNIRYYFFAKMYDHDNDLRHYTLELPYEMIKSGNGNLPIKLNDASSLKLSRPGDGPDQELDMFYYDGKECLCVEIKFHRSGTHKSDFPHTEATGEMFNDMKRLQLIQSKKHVDVRKLFLYITDPEMDDYLQNASETQRNSQYRELIKTFYTLEQTDRFKSIDFTDVVTEQNLRTFTSASSKSFNSQSAPVLNVKLLYSDAVKSKSPSLKESKGREKMNCYVKMFEIE